MFPVIGVAASNGLLTGAISLGMSSFSAAWTLYELWHWTAGYNISSMELVDLRESKLHEGTYLAGTLNYTSGKVLQFLIPVFTVLGFQLWVGTQTMVVASGDADMTALKLSGVTMLLSALSSLAPHAARRPGLHVFGENLHVLFLAVSSWLVTV
jgi:hypothetical protein